MIEPHLHADGDETAAVPDGDEAAEEELPPPDDPYWDEVTDATLALLGSLRAAHRRQRIRSIAYLGYVAVLVVGMYVVAPLATLIAAPPTARPDPELIAVTPLAGVAVVLLVVVAAVRDALWRGPVLVDVATAAWILPTTIRRGRLLRPVLRSALLLGGLAAVPGLLAGAMLQAQAGGPILLPAAAGAAGGGVTGVLAVAVAALTESATGRPLAVLRRIGAWLWLLPALPAGYVALWLARPSGPVATAGRRLTDVLLWSGPWGWPVQPLAAALPGGDHRGPGWVAGLVASVLVTAGAVIAARRRIASVPARALRIRSAAVDAVAASLVSIQPRQARLVIRSAQGFGAVTVTRGRLPAPRRRWLLWPWRDATALLRAPSRLLWGLLWLAVAALLISAAGPAVGLDPVSRHVIGVDRLWLTLPGLLAGYLAAAQLVEPARLDADDPRVARSLPIDVRRLALWHAVVPTLVLLVGLLAMSAALAGAGLAGSGLAGSHLAGSNLLGLGLALPGLVGAALVSAYRGDLPVHLLVGTQTPMGDTGPSQVLSWYARGPLVTLLLLVPLALGVLPLDDAVFTAMITLSWAVTRGRRVLGG